MYNEAVAAVPVRTYGSVKHEGQVQKGEKPAAGRSGYGYAGCVNDMGLDAANGRRPSISPCCILSARENGRTRRS